jgi:hypothetical protein
MENLYLLLPICLSTLAAVFPFVGVWWFCRVLRVMKGDENVVEQSTLPKTEDKCSAKHHPPDLLGIVTDGTESIVSDDVVEACLPSIGISENDMEAPDILRGSSLTTTEQLHVTKPKIWHAFVSQDEISSPPSFDTSHDKDHCAISESAISETGSSDTSDRRLPRESSRRGRLKQHHHKQQQKSQVDVRRCVSETCETCHRGHHAQVQFVTAQKLNPTMVQKLKLTTENTRWWEMGESFHD